MLYVDGSSEETIKTDLGSIAMEKQSGDSAEDAVRWMESHDGWLLILDSADDPSLDLSKFIPRTSQGSTIITSRNAQTQVYGLASGSSCEIFDMNPVEAKKLFLWRAGLAKSEEERVSLGDREDGIVRTILKVCTCFNSLTIALVYGRGS